MNATIRKLGAAFALALAAAAHAQLSTVQVVQKVAPAVVSIAGSTAGGAVQGSGFIISADGTIVTSLHLLRDFTAARVQLANGSAFDSFSIVQFDQDRDLAVIRVPGTGLPAVELGDSDALEVGEEVIAIGNPRGLGGSVTKGVISALRDDRRLPGVRVIQTDAAINPGNSGGPLVNSRGQAIGVVPAKLKNAENVNFAVPVGFLRALLHTPPAALTLGELRSKLGIATASTPAPVPAA